MVLVSQWVSAAKDVTLAVSAVVGLRFAWLGVDAWRRELAGRARFDVARKLLESIAEIRESVRSLRSPAILGNEFPESFNKLSISERTTRDHYEATAYVYEQRWKPVFRAMKKFEAASIQAEALFVHEDIYSKTIEVRKEVNSLRFAVSHWLSTQKEPEHYSNSTDFIRQLEAKIYNIDGEDDFSKSFTAALDGVRLAMKNSIERASRA